MALALVGARAVSSRWRIRSFFSGGDPSTQPASAFTLTRTDGSASTIAVASTFAADTGQLELALSERLVPDVNYTLAWGANTAILQFTTGANDSTINSPSDDPAAEILGLDMAWLFGDPTADCNAPTLKGMPSFVNDMISLAWLAPGELVQFPTAGANVPSSVNGPNTESELAEISGRLQEQWRSDDRTADALCNVSSDTAGNVNFTGSLKPRGLEEGTVPVSSNATPGASF